MPKLYVLIFSLMVFPAMVFPVDMQTIESTVNADIQSHLTPSVISAIKAQNAANAKLDIAGIKELDKQWQDEITSWERPLINKVLLNPVSAELDKLQLASKGRYVEIFITDNKGLNVGASEMTSDYWQGDEDKFTKVFPKVGATYSEGPSFDESAQAYVGEVDGTISDGNVAIGTYTVKIKVE